MVFIREEQFLERPVCLGFVFVSFVFFVLSCFLMLTLVFVPVFVYCYVLCTVSHKNIRTFLAVSRMYVIGF